MPVHAQVPAGWKLVKDDAESAVAETDHTISHSGKASGRVTIPKPARHEVAFLQPLRADSLRGKRILISGYIKSALLSGEAGLVAITNNGGRYSLYFPSEERLTKDQPNWKKCTVVIEIPTDTMLLSFGLWVRHGSGKLWLDEVNFVAINDQRQKLAQPRKSSPLTRDEMSKIKEAYDAATDKPVNLGFEQ